MTTLTSLPFAASTLTASPSPLQPQFSTQASTLPPAGAVTLESILAPASAPAPPSPRAPRTIFELLHSPEIRREMALTLPRFLSPERMTRLALTAIHRTPALRACTTESLLAAILRACALGIEPDGHQGRLLPRWNARFAGHECTFVPQARGLAALVRRSADARVPRPVREVETEVVCAGDLLQVTKGLQRDLRHAVAIRGRRGPVIGAYAVLRYRDGGAAFDFMRCEELAAPRAANAPGQPSTELADDPDADGARVKMAVLLRLLAIVDLSEDTAERIALAREHEPAKPAATPQSAPTVPPADAAPGLFHAAPAAKNTLGKSARADAPEASEEAGARGPRARWQRSGPSTPAARRAQALAADAVGEGKTKEGEGEEEGEGELAAKPALCSEAASEALSFAAELRAAYPDHDDAAMLVVFRRFHFAAPSAQRLEEVAPRVLQQALEDPESFASELPPPNNPDSPLAPRP